MITLEQLTDSEATSLYYQIVQPDVTITETDTVLVKKLFGFIGTHSVPIGPPNL